MLPGYLVQPKGTMLLTCKANVFRARDIISRSVPTSDMGLSESVPD